jgi:hypothetical protein
MGPSKLADEFQKSGFSVEIRGDFVVIKNYVVPIGRFANQTIELAFQTPADYEVTPPGGFHTSPHLGTVGHNAVHNSPLGSTFAYWSRPIQGWPKQRNSKRLLSNVNAVLGGA